MSIMAWRSSISGHRKYYYHFTRDDDHVTATYIGDPELAERLDSAIRQRKAERLARLALQERLDHAEQPVIAFANACNSIFIAYKYSTGYYLNKRVWRKRGHKLMLSHEEIQKQLEQEQCKREFETGDEDELIRKYKATPAINTLDLMLDTMGADGFQKEAYRHQYSRMRRRLLAGQGASTIVGIMAGRIALDYLDVYYHDQMYYINLDNDEKVVESIDRCRTRASRRLVRSIRAFADLTRTSINDVQKSVDTLKLRVVGDGS
jgi:hypothetical protein